MPLPPTESPATDIDWLPMDEAAFAAWLARSLPAYARSHVEDGKWAADEALAKAQAEHDALLPQGLATPGHHFRLLRRGPQVLGHVWFAEIEEGGRRGAYVYDIEVRPEARRQGVARRAFELLEDAANALGLAFIGLHVFGTNTAARQLYSGLGFVETNVRMRKMLTPPKRLRRLPPGGAEGGPAEPDPGRPLGGGIDAGVERAPLDIGDSK